MSNTFLTSQSIARQALPILRENLVFPALVHTDFSADFCKPGDTVYVRKPAVFEAQDFSGSITTQDIEEGMVEVKLDKIADVSVELTAKDMALSVTDFASQILEPAMSAIAEKINRDGLALYKDIPYCVGSAGSTPSALDDFANTVKALNTAKAPLTDRSVVWNVDAIAEFQKLAAIVNAEKSGSTAALREGSIGRILGLNNYMSQGIHTHAAGTLSGVSGLKTSEAVSEGADTVKISGTGTLKKGDMIEIGGKHYTVTEDAADVSGTVTAKVYPELPQVNSGTAVTVVANHTANIAFHKNAFAFITRPLEAARGADSYVTSWGGITLRVTMDYDISTKKQILSIDTLYGVKTLYPELAVRVLG